MALVGLTPLLIAGVVAPLRIHVAVGIGAKTPSRNLVDEEGVLGESVGPPLVVVPWIAGARVDLSETVAVEAARRRDVLKHMRVRIKHEPTLVISLVADKCVDVPIAVTVEAEARGHTSLDVLEIVAAVRRSTYRYRHADQNRQCE